MSTTTPTPTRPPAAPTAPAAGATPAVRDVPAALVERALARRSYAVLATVSPAGRPHAAGVLYAAVGTTLYVATDRSSRKGRNLVATPHAGVTVPVRRLPVGPPAGIHLQATAEVLAVDHPDVVALAADGSIAAVTSHGELERPDGCIVRLTPGRTVHTYGLGMSLWRLLRDPLDAVGRATLPA